MLRHLTTVFAVVFTASLLGILTRPLDLLAAFWPANAVLLGMFVRCPRLATPGGWVAAIAAYMTADLVTGGAVALSIWLTVANLAGVVVGVMLFRHVSVEDRALQRPLSVLYLFGILVAASATSALFGAGAAPIFFEKGVLAGAAFWFTTELVNGIVVLPAILTAPARVVSLVSLILDLAKRLIPCGAPIVALTASVGAGYLVGGIGALTFPSPALLWCAIVYPLFPAIVVTMLVSVWHLIALSWGFTGEPFAGQITDMTMTDRLGVMLLALGPLTVASSIVARGVLMNELARLATYDTLTGTLTRAAFRTQAETLISMTEDPFTVMVLDIDHFKSINDTQGHSAGDRALTEFARTVQSSLRKSDLFGRIGGEEFAIVLPQMNRDHSAAIADRIRIQIEDLRCPLSEGQTLQFTVSIGFVHTQCETRSTLDALLIRADRALYEAKAAGRNRIIDG